MVDTLEQKFKSQLQDLESSLDHLVLVKTSANAKKFTDQICELEILVTQVKQEASQSVTNLIREAKQSQETVARLSERITLVAEQKDSLARVNCEMQASLRSVMDQC